MFKRSGMIAGLLLIAWPADVMAQIPSLDGILSNSGGPASGRIAQLLILLTILSVIQFKCVCVNNIYALVKDNGCARTIKS